MARIDPRLGSFATTMRNAPTPFESRLWRALSGSKLSGLKFRRQSVIDSVIVDFFCPALGLAIEVDGRTHDSDRDARRDEALMEKGIQVLRFSNEQIAGRLDAVLRVIADEAVRRPQRWPGRPSPGPSPEGEGGI